jgi:hypothetical protein
MTLTNNDMCSNCRELIGAHRHIAPHKDLALVNRKPVSSMFGSVDETYYECKNCKKTWLYETGSAGQGWIA